MRKSLLNFQRFGQGKIEFNQEKSVKSQGILFKDGHPVICFHARCWYIRLSYDIVCPSVCISFPCNNFISVM